MKEREPSRKWKHWKRFLTGQLPLEQETTLFILANALDVFMTYWLLSYGGFVESNPIARFFLERWGMKGMIYFKFGLVAFIAVVAQIIATRNIVTAQRLLNGATLVVAGVVVYSFTLFVRFSGTV